ncbi:MAG: UDP-glucose 4-epimerase GalE, partial [Pseudomonadota bacterium]
MTVLITGGAGYIGSHTLVEFLQAGREIVVLDNFCNSTPESLRRVEALTGKSITMVEGDIRDRPLVEATLRKHKITSVVHFAGLKAVGASGTDPLEYYNINVVGSERLFSAMKACEVFDLVFSSSATVYGEADYLPFDEQHPLRVTNPYGRTKLMIEDMLRDLATSDQRWRIAILRYFNPVGAHASGMIGEDPRGVPSNLMPYVSDVALGKRPRLTVHGDDYDTPDGTGIRDFIHVVDLAQGHLSALDGLTKHGNFAVNLGTGQGHSVLEMVSMFERISNRKVQYEVGPRRPGDISISYAATDKAYQLLGWRARLGLYEMCR